MNSDSQQPPIHFKSLGLLDYTSTWAAMKSYTVNRTSEQQDECWLLQHQPVFTLGQAGKPEHILDPHDIPVIKSDRGGQVTYHGPGQLVAYTLIDLKPRKLGIRQLVDVLETSIIELLATYGIRAAAKKGAPGVYVGDKKIAALGLRIKNGCSYHGLSLNVDMDLTPFSYINPCGFPGMQVTQISDLISDSTDNLLADAEEKLVKVLSDTLL